MAINSAEFTIKVDTNLKSNKKSTKFFINFTANNRRHRKLLDYSDKDWDKRTRINKAKTVLQKAKEKAANSGSNISSKSTLNQITEMYFAQREQTDWTIGLKRNYDTGMTPLR